MNTVEILYADMCSNCPKSTYCHEDCVECEDFEEALGKMTEPKNDMVGVPPEDSEGR